MALLRSRDDRISGALLLHAYLHPQFQTEIRKRTIHGATVDRIPLNELSEWEIRLPVERNLLLLSAALGALHDCIAQRTNETRDLEALRDTLLPQLMSGKLRVRDAERVVEDAI
jgi:type I restriction enzyme, S subunit